MKTKIFKEEKAITLVALIITIIVLLILAMVSISLVMNGGIINKSKSAVDKYSQEEIEEQIKLAYSEWQMGQYTGVTDDAATFMQTKLRQTLGDNGLTVSGSNGIWVVKLSNNDKYIYDTSTGGMLDEVPVSAYPTVTASTNNSVVTENSKYVSGTFTAVIPAGYTISNVAAEQSIENGLVIKKGNNEWVWIPVANVTDLYTTNSTNTEWILCGTSGDNKIVSSYASKADIITIPYASSPNRTTPGTTSEPYHREPDTVVGNGTEYDNVQANWSASGFSSFINMATGLRDDYKNMIDSIRKYGGFYVGRYELGGSVSSPVVQDDQTVLTNTDWYNLYKACKGFEDSSVYSRMMYGCTWDQICLFINQHGDKVSLTDSTTYGNYGNSSGNANVTGKGSKQVTGFSDYWKANNIYDIAGNCYEWTQEARGADSRAYRGGMCYDNGDGSPVTSRGSHFPTDSNVIRSSRPILYIK